MEEIDCHIKFFISCLYFWVKFAKKMKQKINFSHRNNLRLNLIFTYCLFSLSLIISKCGILAIVEMEEEILCMILFIDVKKGLIGLK